MKMSQAKLREECEHLAKTNAPVTFGAIKIQRSNDENYAVSLGNVRVVVFKGDEMVARGRFNDLSKFILHEIKAQP